MTGFPETTDRALPRPGRDGANRKPTMLGFAAVALSLGRSSADSLKA